MEGFMEKEFSTKAIMSNLEFFLTIIRGTLGPRAISNLEITWVVCKRSRVKWEGHLLFLTNEFADLAADRVASFILKDIFIADLASGIEC